MMEGVLSNGCCAVGVWGRPGGTWVNRTIAVDNRSLPLIIRRTGRKKSIGVELTCRHEVVVRVPRTLGEAAIAEGVSKCLPWLRKRLALLSEMPMVAALGSGSEVLLLGEVRRLTVVCGQGGQPRVVVGGSEVQVMLPETCPAAEAVALREALIAWYRSQAAEVIGELVARYSVSLQLPLPPISISRARRRWGSCGVNGRLNFAWRLVMAPLGLIEYVVVHELCHLKRRDHSPAFWAHVCKTLPDYRERRRRLHRQGLRYDL